MIQLGCFEGLAFVLDVLESFESNVVVAQDARRVTGELFELIRCFDAELAGMGPVQPPLLIGQGLDEVNFQCAFGLQVFGKFTAESFVGLFIFVRQDDSLARCSSVTTI